MTNLLAPIPANLMPLAREISSAVAPLLVEIRIDQGSYEDGVLEDIATEQTKETAEFYKLDAPAHKELLRGVFQVLEAEHGIEF